MDGTGFFFFRLLSEILRLDADAKAIELWMTHANGCSFGTFSHQRSISILEQNLQKVNTFDLSLALSQPFFPLEIDIERRNDIFFSLFRRKQKDEVALIHLISVQYLFTFNFTIPLEEAAPFQ